MFITNHPHAGEDNKSIPQRRNILSLPKLLVEGTPDEHHIILGWLLDTHRLLVLLPKDMFKSWLEDLTLAI
jgi:hypothetical protein